MFKQQDFLRNNQTTEGNELGAFYSPIILKRKGEEILAWVGNERNAPSNLGTGEPTYTQTIK